MNDESEAAKRLMRLLAADFRYAETVDDTIWLDHPRTANGRVIFYPHGQVSSIGNDEFAQVWLDDPALFERYMATVLPTRRRDRLAAWGDDIITWTVFGVMMGVMWLMLSWVTGVVRGWWSG